MAEKKFRLITRADFDGVVCGALFNKLEMVDDIVFTEPNDMQQGRVPVSDKDISANLPFVEGIHLCLDHHASEIERVGEKDNLIIDADAPSAARIVYRHFGDKEAFPNISEDLLDTVDQADSAQYSEEDILAPEKWTLLNFIVDPRTGSRGFPDVVERVNAYQYQKEFSELQLVRCSTVHGNLVVADLREEDPIYTCNRFLIYALNPECNISMHLMPGTEKGTTTISVGKSILDRSSKTNIGSLLLEFGGVGHKVAGGCKVKNEDAEAVVGQLIERITADG